MHNRGCCMRQAWGCRYLGCWHFMHVIITIYYFFGALAHALAHLYEPIFCCIYTVLECAACNKTSECSEKRKSTCNCYNSTAGSPKALGKGFKGFLSFFAHLRPPLEGGGIIELTIKWLHSRDGSALTLPPRVLRTAPPSLSQREREGGSRRAPGLSAWAERSRRPSRRPSEAAGDK